MGLCGSSSSSSSSAEAKKNAELQKEQLQASKKQSNYVTLLLLGTGDSGKTTWRKQISNIYAHSFDSQQTRQTLSHVIIGNLLQGCQAIGKALNEQLKGLVEVQDSEAREAIALLLNYKPQKDGQLTPELAMAVKKMWTDENVQKAYQLRNKFQLQDCFQGYANSCANSYPAWGGAGWIPTIEECVKARIRTSGIIEEEFVYNKTSFKLFDAGGQRAERRKWIHCFNNVTAVIFMASSSEYDQVLFEDDSQNRLVESLALFADICNSKWFEYTPVILFLNKKDLFMEKFHVRHVPINESGLFPDAPTDYNNPDEALEWMSKQFLAQRSEKLKDKYIWVHHTNATDASNIQQVFQSCTTIILEKSLSKAGMDLG